MCKRNSKILILFAMFLVIGLLCCIMIFDGEDSEECPKCNSVTESKSYSYKDIAGYYSAEDKVKVDSQSITVGYTLFLLENGTFRYQYVMNTSNSVIGNYIIVDDEIRLNYLFTGGSDAGINATNGSKVLKIKDKNTLVDDDAHFYTNGGLKTIDLTKDNSNSYNTNEFDLNYIVNNYGLFNNATR